MAKRYGISMRLDEGNPWIVFDLDAALATGSTVILKRFAKREDAVTYANKLNQTEGKTNG
jgi:hypothetical protein